MALPSSGAISLNNVNVELGNSGTASINMGSSAVRDLFGVSSGAIDMADGYGKSSAPQITATDYFNTVLYTGNATARSITGVGFQPDFVWIKQRSAVARRHHLTDAVRGATKNLFSDWGTAEETSTSYTTSFNSDGFSLGTSSETNGSDTYVAWNWKANGSGVSNTSGSITSTVSANAPAGFSIIGWTGNGTAGATIGHGLSTAPEMIIVKGRTYAENWAVYIESLGNTSRLALDATIGEATPRIEWNSTTPTSTVITLGNHNGVNKNTDTYIAYAFHSVAGYSKVGSYTGNGSSGHAITTGFQPRYVMTKRTDGVSNWYIHDSARGAEDVLQADSTHAEYANLASVAFTSTGFQLNTTSASQNASGGSYIYLAFA